MKLPWVRKYVIIAFHVVITFIAIYIIKTAIDMGGVFLMDLNGLILKILNGILKIMSVFSVIIGAFIIAYVFDPLVDFFQKRWTKMKYTKETERRTMGAVCVFVLFGVFLIIMIFSGYRRFENYEKTPLYIINKSTKDFMGSYEKFRVFIEESEVSKYLMPMVDIFTKKFMALLQKLGNWVVNFAISTSMSIGDIIVTLTISFYFMRDKKIILKNIRKTAKAFIPKKINKCILSFLNDINNIFSNYIRGQLIDATLMAIIISFVLYLMKVDFPIIIGIISGYSNIIPYFGALVGQILAVLVAMISGGISKAFLIAIAMIILQQIDGLFIVPKIVGNKVSLNPVFVIISLTIFGKIFGVIGMIFAVPIFAIIKLYALKIYKRKTKNSAD